jgi:hypothetical protein
MNDDKGRIREQIYRVCAFLNITPDVVDFKKINTAEEFTESMLALFKLDSRIFRSFVCKIIDLEVRKQLDDPELQHLTAKLVDGQIERNEQVQLLKELQRRTSLILPRPVLSRRSLLFQITLLVGPTLILLVFAFLNLEFTFVSYGIVKFGFIVGFILIPYVTCYLLFPRLFQPSVLDGVNTYPDLINTITAMNIYFFIEDDYQQTRKQLDEMISIY